MSLFTRRRLVVSTISLYPSYLMLGACSGTSADVSSKLGILARLVELQLPLSDVDDSIYNTIASSLIDASSSDQGLAQALSAATDMLGASDWIKQNESDQLNQLRNLESEPWFFLIKFRASGLFFEHPDIWKLIGYEGSSLETGGYKFDGFDDIDWLPVSSE